MTYVNWCLKKKFKTSQIFNYFLIIEVFNTFRYNYSIENCMGLCWGSLAGGLELRLLVLQIATWPPLVIGFYSPRMTFPKLSRGSLVVKAIPLHAIPRF